MSQLPEGVTQEEIDQLAKLRRGIEKAQAAAKLIEDKIRAGARTGTNVYGDVIVKKVETIGTFDKKRFEVTFPFSSHPEFYSPTLDTKKIEKELGEARTDFYTPGTRLSIDVVND